MLLILVAIDDDVDKKEAIWCVLCVTLIQFC